MNVNNSKMFQYESASAFPYVHILSVYDIISFSLTLSLFAWLCFLSNFNFSYEKGVGAVVRIKDYTRKLLPSNQFIFTLNINLER